MGARRVQLSEVGLTDTTAKGAQVSKFLETLQAAKDDAIAHDYMFGYAECGAFRCRVEEVRKPNKTAKTWRQTWTENGSRVTKDYAKSILG